MTAANPISRRPEPRPYPGGLWTATVVTLSPLSVVAPHAAGDNIIQNCSSAVFVTPLAVGDPVFIAALDGYGGVFVVCARRDIYGPVPAYENDPRL